jgi:hypothetical protein
MSFLGKTGSTSSGNDTTPINQVFLHRVSAYCMWTLHLATCVADGALRRTSRMSESFVAEIPSKNNVLAIGHARGLEQLSEMLVARKNLSKSPRIARFRGMSLWRAMVKWSAVRRKPRKCCKELDPSRNSSGSWSQNEDTCVLRFVERCGMLVFPSWTPHVAM